MIEWRYARIILWLVVVFTGAWHLVKFPPESVRTWPIMQTAERKLLTQYQRHNFDSRLVFIVLEGPPLRELAHASHELTKALRESGLFLLVANGSAEQAVTDHAFLWRHRFLLSPDVTAGRFDADLIRAAIEQTKEIGVLEDPTDEISSVTAGMPTVTAKLRHDAWFSQDETRALLLAVTRASDPGAQRTAMAAVTHAHATMSSGTRLNLSGPAVEHARAAAPLGFWQITAMLAIGLMALSIQRDSRKFLITLLSALAAITVGLAAVALAFGTLQPSAYWLTPLLLALSAILSLIDVDRSIETRARPWWKICRTRSAMAIVLIFGAALLTFSPLVIVAMSGLFISAGTSAAWLSLHLFQACNDSQRDRSQFRLLVTMWRNGCAWVAGERRRSLMVNAGVITGAIACVILLHQLIAPGAMSEENALRAEFGIYAPDAIIAVHGPTEQAALELAESITPLLRRLFDQGTIGGFDSPTRYLPSESTQVARQSVLPDLEKLRMDLTRALRGPRFHVEQLKLFFDDLDASRGGAVTRELLASTSFYARANAMTQRDGNESIAWLELYRVANYAAVRNSLEPAVAGASLINVGQEAAAQSRTAILTAGLAVLTILGMSAALLRWSLCSARGRYAAATVAAIAALTVWSAVAGTAAQIVVWLPLCAGISASASILWAWAGEGREVFALGASAILFMGLAAATIGAGASGATMAVAIFSSLALLGVTRMLAAGIRQFKDS